MRALDRELSDRTQYFLDASSEQGHISATCYAAITLMGDADVVADIIDERTRVVPLIVDGHINCTETWFDRVGAMCHELERYAQYLVLRLPPDEQRAFAAHGLVGLRHSIANMARFVATNHMVDTTRGGNMLPFLRHVRCDDQWWPYRRNERHLRSLPAIRRAMIACGDADVRHLRSTAQLLRLLPWPCDLAENGFVIDALDAYRDRIRRQLQREQERLRSVNVFTDDDHAADVARFMGVSVDELRERVREIGYDDADRDVARPLFRGSVVPTIRAALVAPRLVGTERTNAFLRREPVRLVGATCTLVARLTGDPTRTGHGSMAVVVHDTGDVRLGSLCVYFENAPVLDQLCALALHVGAGHEGDVLRSGNAFALTAAGSDHPLMSMGDEHVPRFIRERGRSIDDQHRADARWFATYGDRYVRVMEEHLLGRDVRRYRDLWAGARDRVREPDHLIAEADDHPGDYAMAA